MDHFTDLVAIAVSRPDGGVTVRRIPARASADAYDAKTAAAMGFGLQDDGTLSREITDELIEADLDKCGLNRVSWHIVSEDELPDREFRDAWAMSGKSVAIDMPKARDIYRQSLRAVRAPILAALDVEYQRADEMDDRAAKTAIVAKKQALRDAAADPAIDAARTLADLKAIQPMLSGN